MMLAARWLDRIDAGDRWLLDHWVLDEQGAMTVRRAWIMVTHCGSAGATIGSVVVPLLIRGWPRGASLRAGVALAASHVAVQVLKRCVSRVRPAQKPIIACPDLFSFPSGHAAAALAIAASYALSFPALAAPLLTLGVLVGVSRITLGVHYPGDVIAGQVLAVAAVAASLPLPLR